MDVKTTFIHTNLEEEIYMKQPEGFMVKGNKELVWSLNFFLYGLKQPPRMWYQKFDTYIRGLGFTRSKEDHCVYFKLIGDRVIIWSCIWTICCWLEMKTKLFRIWRLIFSPNSTWRILVLQNIFWHRN